MSKYNGTIGKTTNYKTRKKSFVEEELNSISIDYSVIDDVIDGLKEDRKYYKAKGYINLILKTHVRDDYASTHLYGCRPETAEEFATRLLYIDELEALQAKRDLEELQRLQNKLGV